MVLPSITELLTRIHGDKYGFVDPELLERSAGYGTRVHKEIQDIINTRECGFDLEPLLEGATQETKNYFNMIEPIYGLLPLMTEVMVVLYNRDATPVAAGRFDMVCKEKESGAIMLCDFKTTSTLNTSLVSDQLNLYKLAAEQSGYFQKGEITKLAAIHLSGEKRKLKEIQIFGEKFYNRYLAVTNQDF